VYVPILVLLTHVLPSTAKASISGVSVLLDILGEDASAGEAEGAEIGVGNAGGSSVPDARCAQPRAGLRWVVWGRYEYDAETGIPCSTIVEGPASADTVGREMVGEAVGSISVVTGRGLHSKGEGPVVKPAIESLLRARGVQFAAVEGNEGCLSIAWPLREGGGEEERV